MKLRTVLFVLFASSLSLAASQSCENGRGAYKMPLWDGFFIQLSPTDDGKCRTELRSDSGESLYSAVGDESHIESGVTGRDVNADGKNDAVVETLVNNKHRYAILTPGMTPPLIREMATTVPLTFVDKDGDGKIEIYARERAFINIDGLPEDVSPTPMAIFRISGNRIYPVMNSFWPEYEADINRAKSYISKDALAFLQGVSPKGADERKPTEDRAITETKGYILQVVLDYIYGGKAQQGWAYLIDNWQDRDKDRIRSLITSAMNHGLRGEINAIPPQPAAVQAAQPAQPSPAAAPENK
jgi:hypothetical protein